MSPVYMHEQKRAPDQESAGMRQSKKRFQATGIPDESRRRFESLSGFSYRDVRVHYNSSEPERYDAYAYTQGNEIHIGPGNESYLEHELGHVAQQKQGRVRATGWMNGEPVNNSPTLENEADNATFARFNTGEVSAASVQAAPVQMARMRAKRPGWVAPIFNTMDMEHSSEINRSENISAVNSNAEDREYADADWLNEVDRPAPKTNIFRGLWNRITRKDVQLPKIDHLQDTPGDRSTGTKSSGMANFFGFKTRKGRQTLEKEEAERAKIEAERTQKLEAEQKYESAQRDRQMMKEGATQQMREGLAKKYSQSCWSHLYMAQNNPGGPQTEYLFSPVGDDDYSNPDLLRYKEIRDMSYDELCAEYKQKIGKSPLGIDYSDWLIGY